MIPPVTMEELTARRTITGDGCWRWDGATTNGGYGTLRRKGTNYRVTRLAMWLTRGEPVPRGIEVCHSCDNPACFNPAHLFLGTHTDNMRDGWSKGRVKPPTNAPQGEKHHDSRLTEDDVRAIRDAYATGFISQPTLARAYKIHQASVWAIIHRKSWKSVV